MTNLDPTLPWSCLLSPYCDWVVSRWTTKTEAGLAERDYTVMTLGFAGETGEVAEALLAGATTPDGPDRLMLTKELGDVSYYWARIVRAFGLSEARCAERAMRYAPTARENAMLHLCARVGRVTELMKKRVRDDTLDAAVLEGALGDALGAWLAVCAQAGIGPAEALVLNQRKVNDRHARGVVRGSGDNR